MNRLKRDLYTGILFVLAAGSLGHFVYEWSGYSAAAGFFFPVSESTWEHMKLCFFPMLLYSCYMGIRYRSDDGCVFLSMLSGTLAGTFSIPAVFYIYTGVLGFHTLILDLLTFLVSVLIGFCTTYRQARSCPDDERPLWPVMAVVMLAACFFVFTYAPPALGIFQPPG